MAIKVKIEWAKFDMDTVEYEAESIQIDGNGGLHVKTRAGQQAATPDTWKSVTITNLSEG